ncbi:unnamed protein product [Brachionus calyciflorus]|uniref:Uncharacterized protein n=1 Tax=Brachionus calyciflorus TaxID=104777 RepID=A0A814PAA4_9BILA|nr:unnamed protein product [Brachionus calyciflorus]
MFGSDVIRKYFHDVLSDAKIKAKIAEQELKQEEKNKCLPNEPTDYTKLVISNEFALTQSKKQFLRYDNQSAEKRIIMFFDDKALEISKSEQWFMDGTFKCSPKELLQLFSIHAQTDHLTTPCVFILSKTRDEECYREAFGILKDLALEHYFINRPLASVLGTYFYQDLENSSNFEYIRSTMNIDQIYQERRDEREKKEQRIDERISNITDKQINEEVFRLWNLKDPSGKRKRIS